MSKRQIYSAQLNNISRACKVTLALFEATEEKFKTTPTEHEEDEGVMFLTDKLKTQLEILESRLNVTYHTSRKLSDRIKDLNASNEPT